MANLTLQRTGLSSETGDLESRVVQHEVRTPRTATRLAVRPPPRLHATAAFATSSHLDEELPPPPHSTRAFVRSSPRLRTTLDTNRTGDDGRGGGKA